MPTKTRASACAANLEELPQLSLLDVFNDDEKRRFKRHIAPGSVGRMHARAS
jgi:hypothetical protein